MKPQRRMNSVNLMGRLVRAPELKFTPSGTPVLSFTIAVDRGTKDENGYRAADFIDCVAWRQTAEFICKYFTKGQMIALTGALRVRSWESEDAVRHKATEVKVSSVYFAGSKPATAAEPAMEPETDEDEDLPF